VFEGSGSLPGGNNVANTDPHTIRFGSGSNTHPTLGDYYEGTDTVIFDTSAGHITASGNIITEKNITAVSASIQHLDGPEGGGISFVSGNPTLKGEDGAQILLTDDAIISGGNNRLIVEGIISASTLTIANLANQGSEATAVMINGSNVVGTRELGSNAFTSTTIGTTTNALTAGNGLTSAGAFNGGTARTFSVDSASFAPFFSSSLNDFTTIGNISASGRSGGNNHNILGGTTYISGSHYYTSGSSTTEVLGLLAPGRIDPVTTNPNTSVVLLPEV
jgi:hypothetical protein